MAISEFNKPACRLISAEAMKALQEVAERFNLDLEDGHGSYGADSFTMKMKFTVRAAEGTESTKEKNFRLHARLMGANPDWFGKRFKQGRSFYTITDLNTNRPKNCIAITRDDGQIFKCGVDYIKAHV